jgi:endo-1,4-beta-D-glucanase Y
MNRIQNLALAVLVLTFSQLGLSQNRSFPQNKFASQVAYPNHVSVGQLNADVVAYYSKWKTDFLRQSNGVTPGGGYYINMTGTGGTGNEITTSEAMGYGMVVTVLMAGQDPNAKLYFDGLFNMFKQHKSTVNPNLMSWLIDKTEAKSKDSDSATDGDMDGAYALLLADKQWGSAGAVNYKAEAVRIITSGIMAGDVNTANNRTMLGDWWDSSWANASRPSDWMTGHMLSYYKATGDSKWLTLRNNTFSMISSIQGKYSPNSGLLPDFVNGATVAPAAANLLESAHDGDYDYNACRTPLRLIVDYAHNNSPEAEAALSKMMAFFYGQSAGGDPTKIMSGYKLSGSAYANYQDSSFIAPVVAASTVNAAYRPLANKGWDYIKSQHAEYYADSITLLSMLYASGNWWNPDDTTPTTPTTPPPTTTTSPSVTTTTLRPPTTTTMPPTTTTTLPLPPPPTTTTTTMPPTQPPATGNLVSNAGFESQLTGWESWGGNAVIVGSGLQHTGVAALRIQGGAGGRGQNVMARIKVGSTYTLRGYARLSASKDPTYLGLQFINKNGTIILDRSVRVLSTGYQQYSVTATVPSGATEAWVYIWKNAGSRTFTDIDDLSLAP